MPSQGWQDRTGRVQVTTDTTYCGTDEYVQTWTSMDTDEVLFREEEGKLSDPEVHGGVIQTGLRA